MAYSPSQISGLSWSSSKETQSISGSRVDFIYGYAGIGSPHGHLVLFNKTEVFNRPTGNLKAENINDQIIIRDNLEKTTVK